MLYRDYENPALLEMYLQEAEERLEDAEAKGADDEELLQRQEDVNYLKERINFAWQDETEDW